MDLALQDLEIGLRQFGFEPRRGELPFAVEAEIVEAPDDHQDDQAGHEVVVEIVQTRQPKARERRPFPGREGDERAKNALIEQDGEARFQGGQADTGGDENGETAGPAAAAKRKAAGEPDRGRREDDPGHPADKVEEEILPQREPEAG